MANASMNQYEKQLYSVFKTFDVDNNEALDKSAVLELCDTLQLENRGTTLVDTLFEKRAERVTFSQFRNGLLSVLGGESPTKTENPESKSAALPICNTLASPLHSDEDSSGREVAPKFVFGSKKYGRRSRPQRAASEESPRHRVSSESRLDCERTRQRTKCKRSASAMESRTDLSDNDATDLDHDKQLDRDQALALCHGLHMHGVDQCLIDRIFESSASNQITVGEFFDKLNSSLTSSIALSLTEAATNGSAEVDNNLVSSDSVVEAWEHAGVQKPRRLLLELGFAAALLRPLDVERALDEELRALSLSSDARADARSLLLLAAHALACLRVESVRHQFDVVRLERDKLSADLAEANRRARMLAQEVDESHARIEADLKTSLKQLEAKHTEATRVAAVEAAADKEKSLTVRLELEAEVARRAEVEARLRTEMETLRDRNEDFQERLRITEAHMALAEREHARQLSAAREAEARSAAQAEEARGAADELAARVREARSEAQRARDRADELGAALEAAGRGARAPWRDEASLYVSAELDPSHAAEDSDSLLLPVCDILDPKELIIRIRENLENVRKTPIINEGNCESCNMKNQRITTLLEVLQGYGERINYDATDTKGSSMDVALQTESISVDAEVADLKKKLSEVTQSHEAERQGLSTVIKELESSLEQMKIEYDKCEEYWAAKLDDERELFADEQRAGDERLADLAARIADYERQFTRAPRLPAIDERRGLEAQVTDLQDELAGCRRQRDAELATKVEEIRQLKSKVEELERRQTSTWSTPVGPIGPVGPGAPVGPVGPGARPVMLHCAELEGQLRRQALETAVCACSGAWGGAGAGAASAGAWGGALRARCARAERAAARLHARLAAADLLVKDLYLENCRLAHTRT